MEPILLNSADLLRVIKGLVFSELKSLRGISDVFGDELRLVAESRVHEEPLNITAEELPSVAGRVARFFNQSASCTEALCSKSALGEWARIILEHWGNSREFVSFDSSGSTGAPKSIKRHYCFIEQDARFLASLVDGAKRIIGLVPANHIYGFIYTVLIPKVLGIECEDKRFLSPGAVVKGLLPGDLIVATPLNWKLITRIAERFPPLSLGVTSTAPCPPEIIKTAYAKGLGKFVEIYGSSESGAMGYRFDPDGPLTLLPTWERVGEEAFTRRFQDGTVSDVFYFQDHLEWIDNVRFRIAGRIDSAVQVAGINVYPGKVAETIKKSDLVEECSVRLMRPDEGDRFKAFVVLKRGITPCDEVKRRLQDYLSENLSHLEQPKSLTFGSKLPRNEMGKLSDW